MRRILLLFVFGMLLFGCANPPQNQTNVSIPVMNASNGTAGQNMTYALPPGYLLQEGDYAYADYILWVDGEVYDTTNATLANESGIYNPNRDYKPLGFTVGFDKGMINGFILNVLGMELNETIIFDVKPELGYGQRDTSKVMVVPRYYNISLFETIPRSYFEERDLEVSNGTGYDTPYGTMFIEDFNDDNVTVFYMMQPGDTFSVNGIPEKVVASYNLTATIEYLYPFKEGETYYIPHPLTGAPVVVTVTDKTDQNITLDGNHPLAGKTLRFQVTIVDIIPADR